MARITKKEVRDNVKELPKDQPKLAPEKSEQDVVMDLKAIGLESEIVDTTAALRHMSPLQAKRIRDLANKSRV